MKRLSKAASGASRTTASGASRKTAGNTSPDPGRWRAVLARDPAAAFFYAVRSTGIYCRPTCAARRPRPDNVRFFDSPDAAERAGFRACLRCKPRAGSAAPRLPWLAPVCRALESAGSPPTLNQLARLAGLTPAYLQRTFKSMLGVSPREYHAGLRRGRLQRALARGVGVDEALYAAGYGSPSRVYDKGSRLLGMTPATLRRKAQGETVRHALARCDLGWLLVAATPRGVCAIEFGDNRSMLTTRLRERFPAAKLEPADAKLERWIARAVSHVREPAKALDLPLDVRGTAFQQRVWQALRDIPAGGTLSYTELARAAGKPRAVRAAAAACAANPVAMAIPCHRALGADGSLRGYRWGLSRKVTLLERERTARPRKAGV